MVLPLFYKNILTNMYFILFFNTIDVYYLIETAQKRRFHKKNSILKNI